MSNEKNVISVDFGSVCGRIGPMHAVNNGPICKLPAGDQLKVNDWAFRAAGIPYARFHDSSFCSSYGGEHTVDVSNIFTDFSADVDDPSAYDFAMTDKYVADTLSCCGVFYRLGSKIEHGVKKYNTLPPADFHKWARVCEHIIAHYTEGWADGFNYDISSWEIWNEPDLYPDDSQVKTTWGGSAKQFYELYTIAAEHLKARFPHLKIGGPALASVYHENDGWLDGFFQALTRDGKRVPLDFLSWHIYARNPYQISAAAKHVRGIMDKYGYCDAESILNEWNYVRDWKAGFVKSLQDVKSHKGAAFTAAVMTEAQHSGIDMCMYYDARPCGFNGLFDTDTLRPLKAYYAFKAFNELYKLGDEVKTEAAGDGVYALAARKGCHGALLAVNYADDDNRLWQQVEIKASGARITDADIFVTDVSRTLTFADTADFSEGSIDLQLENYSFALIRFNFCR